MLFDNLSKTIAYTLTHALPELVAVLIHLIFRIPFGLSSLLILSIDLLSEVPPAISFAWEPAESDVMKRPPRNRFQDQLVKPALLLYSFCQAGVVISATALFGYFLVFLSNGVPLSLLRNWASLEKKARKETIQLPDGRLVGFEEQVKIAMMASTAYYVAIVLSQAVHVFVLKVRSTTTAKKSPFFFCECSRLP